MRRGLFEFNPARHDFGAKTVLGHTIAGHGLAPSSRTPSCCSAGSRRPRASSARSSRRISSPTSRRRRSSSGWRARFRRPTARSPPCCGRCSSTAAFIAALNAPTPTLEKFKDPMQFVVSSLRLAYDGKTITNYHPAVGWLQQLGEPLYGRVTPDGYPLTEAAWSSSGQMVRRFEIARAIGSGNAGPLQQRRQHARADDGISDAHVAAVFRRDRAGARRARRATRSAARRRSRNGTRSCWRRRTGCSARHQDGGTIMALSRRDLLKLALVGAAHPLLPDARHRLAGVCGAGRGRREVPAGVSARRLRRRERRHSGRQRLLLRGRGRRSRCRSPIRPIPTRPFRSRGRTTP